MQDLERRMEDEAAADGDADAAASAEPSKPKHYTPVDPAKGMLMRLDSESVPVERAYTGGRGGSIGEGLGLIGVVLHMLAWPFAALFRAIRKLGSGGAD
jgi:hypothetical protein